MPENTPNSNPAPFCKRLLQMGDSDLKRYLIRGVSGSLSLKILASALGLINSALFARLLGKADYGIFAHTLSLINVICIPVLLGASDYLPREIAAYRVEEKWSLLKGLIYHYVVVIACGSILWIMCALLLWRYLFDQSPRSEVLLLSSPLVFLFSINKLRLATMRGLRWVVMGQLPEAAIRTLIIFTVLSWLFFFHPINGDPYFAVFLEITATSAAFIIGLLFLRRSFPPALRSAAPQYASRTWVRNAMPFVLLGAMFFLNSSLDLVMLGFLRPPSEAGAYKVAIQIIQVVGFILYAVNMAVAPIFSELHKQNDKRRMQRLATTGARIVMVVSFPIIIILLLAGDYFIKLGFGAEYLEGATSLKILCLGQLFNCSLGSVGIILNMTNNEKDCMRGVAITTPLNLLLNLILIPAYGLNGAAAATAISMVVWNVILCYYVYKRLGIKSHAF